jgi:PAS domain S-box-containing protein
LLGQLSASERQRCARVLVVEDDHVQLETVTELLAREGFDVIGCTTGSEALQRAHEQEFGVIILDLHLPDMDGTTVLERLGALGLRIRVIIHTGYGTFAAARSAVNCGAFAFVEKLADPDELLRHVHRAVTDQVSRYAADLEAAVVRRTAALRESESRLRAIIESAPEALIVTDEQGSIDTFSPRAERLFGCSASQALGRPIQDFIGTRPPLKPDEFLQRVWGAAPTFFYNVNGEVFGRRPDGSTVPIDVDLGEVRLHGRRHIAGFVRDLTERLRLEEQLRQAQKMEAIGRLAGGIAHDFNNLLTVIGGYSELLGVKENVAGQDMAQQIQRAVERGAALTRQLLAFSRQQPITPQVLDLNSVVRAAEQMLRRLIGADVELVTELAAGLPPIRADVNQLEQVLLNLAVNARDALPDGGRLTIRTTPAPDGDVLLEVQDTGVGMDEVTRSRLFEPFFTTKPPGKGTGLGLATVYAIVQRCQGRIDVQSAPGHGATFHLHFPRSLEPLPTVAAGPSRVPPQLGRELLLVVEDEAPLRHLLARYLQSEGYTVLAAAGGPDALELLQQRGPEVRLLVTDLTMPKMGGRELAAHARSSFPNLKILYISGYSAAPPGSENPLGPGESYLQKPFPLPALHRAIRELLDGA